MSNVLSATGRGAGPAMSRHEAACMLVDLAYQIQLVAPPRTWIQSVDHPGSRRSLTAILAAASRLRGRPLPSPTTGSSRTGTVTALQKLTHTLGATNTWADAAPGRRDTLANLLHVADTPLPESILVAAKTGALPFDPREQERIARRARVNRH